MEVNTVEEMSWKQFEELTKATDVALVPTGTLEPHGLHAPLGLDNFVAEEIATRLAKQTGAALFPCVRYSCNDVLYDASMWPGALSIDVKTMMSLYTDIGVGLQKQGFKRIVFVNGHWCNTPALQIAAFEIWKKSGAAVGLLEWWVFAENEANAITKFGTPLENPSHANEVETSLLLASKKGPPLVHLDLAVANPKPDMSPEEVELWKRRGFNSYTYATDSTHWRKSANYGNPKLASAADGEKVISVAVASGLDMIAALKDHVRVKIK